MASPQLPLFGRLPTTPGSTAPTNALRQLVTSFASPGSSTTLPKRPRIPPPPQDRNTEKLAQIERLNTIVEEHKARFDVRGPVEDLRAVVKQLGGEK